MGFNKKSFIIYILLIISMVLWGTTFMWSKIALKYYNTNTIVFLRLSISVIILLPILLITQKVKFPKRKDLPLFFLLAFFEPFCYFLGETNGLNYLSPSIASVFISIIPLFTPFVAWYFLKEKITIPNILGIIISVFGIMILVLNKNMDLEVNPIGLALIFVAIIASNGYSVVIKKIPDYYSIFMIIFWQSFIGFFYFLPLIITTSYNDFFVTGLQKEPIIAIIKLGIFGSTIAFLLYMYGLKFMPISKVNVFTNTIPIFTIIVSWIFYGESLSINKIIGILIIVFGVIISQTKYKFWAKAKQIKITYLKSHK